MTLLCQLLHESLQMTRRKLKADVRSDSITSVLPYKSCSAQGWSGETASVKGGGTDPIRHNLIDPPQVQNGRSFGLKVGPTGCYRRQLAKCCHADESLQPIMFGAPSWILAGVFMAWASRVQGRNGGLVGALLALQFNMDPPPSSLCALASAWVQGSSWLHS